MLGFFILYRLKKKKEGKIQFDFALSFIIFLSF